MKKTFVLFFVIFTITITFAQKNEGVRMAKNKIYTKFDTIPEVVKPDEWEINFPLFEINNKFTSAQLLPVLPNDIESLNLEKGKIDFNGKEYEGKIKVTLKSGVKINSITVAELISKYTNLKEGDNYIYSIDGEIILADPRSALVDEKNIMQFKVFPVDYLQNYKNLKLVKILTRTEKNISKANEILIR